MASNYGQMLKISIFGESHSKGIGLCIDGIPSGININEEEIKKGLQRRHSMNDFSTQRNEKDEIEFISGLFDGKTTGSPLAFIIHNNDIDSSSYQKGIIRPSHADLTNYLKYEGFNDYRGGGFSSGRLTAPLVVLGSICSQILKKYNIKILTHISNLGGELDRDPVLEKIDSEIKLCEDSFPVLDKQAKEKMVQKVLSMKEEGNSVGGILESYIVGIPACLGEPYFDSLESSISHLLFSIGGVKGVLFGDGLDFANKTGKELSDELVLNDGKIEFLSNHNGGINGGISNGQPIRIQTIVKPTPSISCKQKTIDLDKKENIELQIKGRHDPTIIHRVKEVVNAVLYYAILDALMANNARKI